MTSPSPCPLSVEVTNGNWNNESYCENTIFMIENKFPSLTSSQEKVILPEILTGQDCHKKQYYALKEKTWTDIVVYLLQYQWQELKFS